MYRNITQLFLGLILLSGCAKKEHDADNAPPLIIVDSFEVWLNLMPGGNPALFFTSVVKVEKKAEAMSDSVSIQSVSLFNGGMKAAHFKTIISDITDDYPDSVKSNWFIYRLTPEEGYSGFREDVYENYTAHIVLTGKFGSLTIKRTGISIQKVY
ncbi:MAG: hypothetical protein AMXMBFR48_02430 [Ignavibacteriales bacterium]